MTDGPVYSAARTGRGPFLFVSGQTPLTPDGAVPEGVDAQAREVLGNVERVLAEHGLGWPQVVKLTYYLCDIGGLAAVRRVIQELVPEPRPAATLVEVGALVRPEFLLEIDAIADESAG